MRIWKTLLPTAAAAVLTFGLAAPSSAQVSFGVNIGPSPVCPYGYYDFAPYRCAPYGYYGPEWFSNGIFVGAGPWFHGPRGFHGHVDRHFDPRYGYHGGFPNRGEHFDRHHDFHDFHGGYTSDGHGHYDNHDGHDHH